MNRDGNKKIKLFLIILLLNTVSAFAQSSAQCKKYMHDMMSIYAYGMVCVDDEQMQRVFDSQSNEQAAQKLLEEAQQHCDNAEEKLFQELEQQVFNKDAQLMQILENPDSDVSAFCQAKVPVIESILQKYK